MRPPLPSPFRLWAEDCLLRRPRDPLPLDFGPVVLALRQPHSLSSLPARELVAWLAGGRSPLLRLAGRWLEFQRPLHSTFATNLLLQLLSGWVPALLRRDLPLRFRFFNPSGAVVVIRNWGELNLPLVRDYFGLRLAVRFSVPRLSPVLLTLFRLRP